MKEAKRDALGQPKGEGDEFKALIVATILDSRTEDAIKMLCEHYRVDVPALGVGVFEGRTKGVAAVYSMHKKKILAAKGEYLYNPFVMIHEFYHHMRSASGKHRGTERQADEFAVDFVDAYQRVLTRVKKTQEAGWTFTSAAKRRD